MTLGQPPGNLGERPSAKEMAEKTVTELTEEITLTAEEKSSIENIFIDFFTEMDEIHESGSRPDRSKIEKLENERDEKVKKIISGEEYDVYSEFMKNRMKPPQGTPPSREN
jgi:hypothetical protein